MKQQLLAALDINVLITAITTILGYFFGKKRGKKQQKDDAKTAEDNATKPRRP